MSNSYQHKIDLLLEEAKSNPVVLVDATAIFSDAIADRKISFDYTQKIKNVCQLWMHENELIKGIYYLLIALDGYYSTKFDAAIQNAKTASKIFNLLNQNDLYGISEMIWGATLRSLGELDKAVQHLLNSSMCIHKNGKFNIYKGYSFYQLGEIYVTINDFKAAEENYLLAVKNAIVSGKQTPLFRAYSGLGNLYIAKNENEKAVEFLFKSLKIAVEPSQKSRALCDLGSYYITIEDFKKAKESLTESYNIRKENGFEDASSTSLIELSRVNLYLNHIDEALTQANEALEITLKFKAKNKTLNCYKILSEIFSKLENWKNAYLFLSKYDKLQTEISSLKLQNIYELKNKQIQVQKLEIELAHKEIKDSINYAKRIQKAILPPDRIIKEYLSEAFILYRPKDVVAGDFYWLEQIGKTTLFAVADCTGHGVPGAMVSVVCHNALNRAVREFKLTKPCEILDKTREIVINEFEKAEEDVKDGMDIAICSLNGNRLEFAGAYNPLWVIRNNKINVTKGCKQPIGKFDKQTPFKNHSIELEKGDTFYLFSDGFADQFGGEEDKKFGTKQFKNLILSIHDKPVHEQKNILENTLHNWMSKSNAEQLDDVCVMGVKHFIKS